MTFSAETALAYAAALARPRRTGSPEALKVADEIAGLLGQFGYRVARQPFEFSTAHGTIIILELLLAQALIAAVLLSRAGDFAPAVFGALLLLLLAAVEPLNRAVLAGSLAVDGQARPTAWQRVCMRLGRRYRAANLSAVLPNAPRDPRLPTVLLVAHLDSKSQPISLAARVLLFAVAVGGAALCAGGALLALVVPAAAGLSVAGGAAALLASAPLLFAQCAGNASPGAIDNASGAGLVLHLAECLSRRADLAARLRLEVLITDAEEMAVMGAAAYARRHQPRLHSLAEHGGLHVLNFDGIGARGHPRYVAENPRGRLVGGVRRAGAERSVPLERLRLAGAMFDHMPFESAGYEAVSLVALGRDTWRVHTSGDTPERLHADGFRQAGLVALRAIELLAA